MPPHLLYTNTRSTQAILFHTQAILFQTIHPMEIHTTSKAYVKTFAAALLEQKLIWGENLKGYQQGNC